MLGADTETCEGYVRTLCLSDGSHIECSDAEQLLTFLWEHADSNDRTYVWYNLGYDLSSILKPYLVAQGLDLKEAYQERLRMARRLELLQAIDTWGPQEAKEADDLSRQLSNGNVLEHLTIGRWSVRVMGDKAWSLKDRRSREKAVWSFDTSKFFGSGFSGVSLEAAARKYLGEGKSAGEEGISRRRLGEEPGYFESRAEAVIRYCIRDAQLTLRLMEKTRDGFERIGMTFPKRPFSKGSVAKQYVRDHHVLDGTRRGLEALERSPLYPYWREAFSGGVFLLRRAGYVEAPEIWDLNSAYPAEMVSLPSLEGAQLVPWGDPRFEECYFKFFRILCPPTPRTPIRDPAGGRKLYGWQAEERVFHLTGPDVEAMDRCGDPYVVLDAVGIYCPSPERPFAFLADLYESKSAVKAQYGEDSIEYDNLKKAINSFYGICAQSRPFETRDTNFIYASYITARCRQKLWTKAKELEEEGGEIVSYATDGLVVSWPEGAPLHASSKVLGEWSVSEAEAGVWFETGIYAILKEDRWRLHNRGLPGLDPVELQGCEGPWLEHSHDSPVRYRTAVIQGNADRVNLFIPQVRRLYPPQSYEEAGHSFPRAMLKADLADYWLNSWPIWLLGEPHEGEDGMVVDGKLWRAREREEQREYLLGRSRRDPNRPLNLRSLILLGA